MSSPRIREVEQGEMELKRIPCELTVCKLESLADIDLSGQLFFIGKTEDELSLVCETSAAPACTVAREDGWKGFRIQGTLDFSLVGILSKIAAVLAQNNIGIFAVSTYDTDYILVKVEDFELAADALAAAGYGIV